MIDLLADDGRGGFGIATALDIERIPYRRIDRPEDFDARALVIAAAEPPPGAAALARRVPTVVFGGDPALARALFGVSGQRADTAAVIPLTEPVWAPAVRRQAEPLGTAALRIPWAPVLAVDAAPRATVLAALTTSAGRTLPAVLEDGHCIWSAVDLGAGLTNLLDESYPLGARRPPSVMPRPALQLYYRAPELVRRTFQRRVYAGLQAALGADADRASDYPVDATGWLLLELVKSLVRRAAGRLVRLARWPAPHGAAAALTHDLEPTRFPYTRGLDALLARIDRVAQPASFGVVARSAVRHLDADGVRRLAPHDVVCHGLEHRGETLRGSREQIAAGIGTSRTMLETQLGRPVTGFRSPRLDRSSDLLWAVEQTGFRYDSSYPDVDRENVCRFGAGVRLNLPFRPPIDTGERRVRPSACLELPVSAPDCIQPLFEGADLRALRRAVRAKIGFVRATGGLYVGIVHAGVFGPRDAARRGAHLGFVQRLIRQGGFWFATLGEICDWWCAREALAVRVAGPEVEIVNHGHGTVDRVRLLVEAGDREIEHALPPLAAGERVTVPFDTAALAS